MASRKRRAPDRVLWCQLTFGSVVFDAYLVDGKRMGACMRDEDGDVLDGTMLPKTDDSPRPVIYVEWHLSPEMAEATLLHEITHAVLMTCGGNAILSPHGVRLSSSDEENVVEGLSAALYDALKRNHMLVIPPRPALPGSTR
jgi:hypothetical protein